MVMLPPTSLFFLLAAMLMCPLSLMAESVFVVHPANPSPTLSENQLRDILLGDDRYWAHGPPVAVAFVVDPESIALLETATGLQYGRLKNLWTRLAFTGRGFQARRFDTPEELIHFVGENEGSLACLPRSALHGNQSVRLLQDE